jgi:hypothetical protein
LELISSPTVRTPNHFSIFIHQLAGFKPPLATWSAAQVAVREIRLQGVYLKAGR